MDVKKLIDQANLRSVNIVLISCALSLLGLNFLLYSFFDFGGVRNLVRAAAAGCMMILLVFRLAENSIRRPQVLMLFLAMFQILLGGTNSLNIAFLLILTVTVLSIHEIDVPRLVFWIMTGLTALVIVCLLLGIVPDEVYTVGTRTRHKLGFVNVNGASMFLFTMLCSYLLFRGDAVRLWELAVVCAVELFIFRLTDSRTPLLGTAALIAMLLLVPRMPEKVSLFCVRAGVTVMFLTAFIWPLPALNSTLGNKILSLRPEVFTDYIANQSALTFLFGGSRVSEIDNAFLLLLYNTGFAVYTTVYCVVLKACENLLKKKSYMKLVYVLTILICSAFEGSAIRPELLCAPLMWIIIFENLPDRGSESILILRAKQWLQPKMHGKK